MPRLQPSGAFTVDDPRVEPCPTTGCWIWSRKISSNGYGQVTIRGKAHNAHRVFWSAVYGQIDAEKVIDHICKNRSCVNPDHLRQVSVRENVVTYSDGPVAQNARRTNCRKCGGELAMHGSRGRTCPKCFRLRDAIEHRLARMFNRINNPKRFAYA